MHVFNSGKQRFFLLPGHFEKITKIVSWNFRSKTFFMNNTYAHAKFTAKNPFSLNWLKNLTGIDFFYLSYRQSDGNSPLKNFFKLVGIKIAILYIFIH